MAWDDHPLLERPYRPPELFVFEEVELGSGYHTFHVSFERAPRGWSEPYRKSSDVRYRSRVFRADVPPP